MSSQIFIVSYSHNYYLVIPIGELRNAKKFLSSTTCNCAPNLPFSYYYPNFIIFKILALIFKNLPRGWSWWSSISSTTKKDVHVIYRITHSTNITHNRWHTQYTQRVISGDWYVQIMYIATKPLPVVPPLTDIIFHILKTFH